MLSMVGSNIVFAISSFLFSAQDQNSSLVSKADEQSYSNLFGELLSRVAGTASHKDDMELLERMMAFAKEIPDDPGVQRLIYIDVISLSASSSDIQTMVIASDRLRELWPSHSDVQYQHLIDLADRAYRTAPRSDRKLIAHHYVDFLVTCAHEKESQDNYPDAISHYRKAKAIARTNGLDVYTRIEEAYKLALEIRDAKRRIEHLSQSIKQNPQNKPAARELVNLLVVKSNDPSAAYEFVSLTGDEQLIYILGLYNSGIESASPRELIEVGGWFLDLANSQSGVHREPLLRRANNWCNQFLETYGKRDALAAQARSISNEIAVKLKEILDANSDEAVGEWVNLIKSIDDLEKLTMKDKVEIEGEEIQIQGGSLVLPISPKSGYELRTRFTVFRGDPKVVAMLIYLPVGKSGTTLRYRWAGEEVAWFDGPDEKYFVEGRGETADREIEMHVAVRVVEDKIAMQLKLNNKQVLDWKGGADELDPLKFYMPPREMGNVFRISCQSNLAIHSLEYRE